jgi:hypothetical protein
VFINEPSIRVNLKPGVAKQCATMEEFFEYVRQEVRNSLTDPRNFRIPADEIQKLAAMYDRVKRGQDAL